MRHFIAKNSDGEVVNKYKMFEKPQVEEYEIEEVDDVRDFEIEVTDV